MAGQRKESTGTRSWTQADEWRQRKQKILDAQFLLGVTPEQAPMQSGTIAQAVADFLDKKESENIGTSAQRKLRYQLGLFEAFMSGRSKFFPKDITARDVLEFRSTWKWADLTRIKMQQNLRGFLRFCLKGEHRTEVMDALATIRETREGKERRKPKPFTESEIQCILDKITDPKLATLVRLLVSTGLAIRDAVQLERKNIKDGWLRIERQKTGRSVRQKLDDGLHRELMAVLNGNERYVFWHGGNLPESETTRLQLHMRKVMKAAGVYIKGDVFHRFRDTCVDYWLGAGWSLTDVAAGLGDTLVIVEKHYADLASKRMEGRLAKLPTRSWSEGAITQSELSQ
jgi:integrase